MANEKSGLVAFWSVIITVVVIVGGYSLIKKYKPEWLLLIDEGNKFPKEGDKIVINGNNYIYQNGAWVIVIPPPPPPPNEQSNRTAQILQYPDFTSRIEVIGLKIQPGIICFHVSPGEICPKQIKRQVGGVWIGYNFVSSNNNTCCYKPI